MKLEVQWLAYLATEKGILDSAKCLVLKHALGPDTDILSFGEKLLDRGYCSDFDQLQDLVVAAHEKAETNEEVPSNPFNILSSPSSPPSKKPIRSSDTSLKYSTKEPTQKTPVAKRSFKPIIEIPTNLPSLNPVDPLNSRHSLPDQVITSSFSKDPPRHRISMRRPEASTSPIPAETPAPTHNTAPPAAAPAQDTSKAAPIEAKPPATVSTKSTLSKERPEVSIEVPDEWPDFDDIESMSDTASREWVVQLLFKSQNHGASDLHLCADARPFIRYNRGVTYLGDHVLTASESAQLNKALLSESQLHEFEKNQDLDYALSFDTHLRYRVNLMLHKDGIAATYRIIPNEVKSLEELGFGQPEIIKKLLSYHNGLIMVTGPLGSGKTATLAALVDELNRTRQDHLITVESPIEIVQHSNQCQITQREVGIHTKTFHSALKGALRQDPDIIVIGEMRDLETVEMAISASETGHLVIGTMHTSDAANTLNRLLDVFPAAQQTQIRSMVAESLRAIVCQRLIPSTEDGVELAYELLLNSPVVGNLIRTNKAEGLSNIIETGRSEGMILMDKSIFALWEADRISDEDAIANLISKPMKQQIRTGTPTEATV